MIVALSPHGQSILLVADGSGGPVSIEAIRRYAQAHNLPWSFTVVDGPEWSAQGPGKDLGYARFDALIGWCNPNLFRWWKGQNLPAVLWGAHVSARRLISFQPDDEAIGQMAARHFHTQAIRCVATIRRWNLPVRQARFAAFLTAATRLGLDTRRYEPPAGLPAEETDAAMVAWLKAAPHPIGVFLHQDRDALALLRTCQSHGLRVPDDVAVLGVDDIPIAAMAVPPLSSIVLPAADISTRMALALHRLLAGATDGDEVVRIAPFWVHGRTSTGPFTTGDAVVDRLRHTIRTAPGKDHRIPALMKRSGLSASQVHRRFMGSCGLAPGEFVRQCRLALAQELLASTDLTIEEVARQCGLQTTAGLWAAFRAARLPSPTRWRQAVR